MDHTHAVSKPGRISHGKQAACLNCRRSKIRCNRHQDVLPCERCRQANLECVVPSHHVGRQKGVKKLVILYACMYICADIWTSSKRTGLEKALHQIEQAIKRPRTEDAAASDAAQKVISNLQDLLNKAQGQGQQVSHSETDDLSENLDQAQSLPSPRFENQEDNLALDDAENPLQLLARASDLQLSPTGARGAQKSSLTLALQTAIPQSSHEGRDPGAKTFFVPVRASRDVGSDIDPVDLGLVTVQEAESLFLL